MRSMPTFLSTATLAAATRLRRLPALPHPSPPFRAAGHDRASVANSTVATVARGAALSCYGVIDLAAPPAIATLGRRLSTRVARWLRRAGAAPGRGRVAVELDVVLAQGLPPSAVARNLIATVSYQIERALELPVERVDIVIDGLRVGPDAIRSV